MWNCVVCLEQLNESESVNINEPTSDCSTLEDLIGQFCPFIDLVSYQIETGQLYCCKSCTEQLRFFYLFLERIRSKHIAQYDQNAFYIKYEALDESSDLEPEGKLEVKQEKMTAGPLTFKTTIPQSLTEHQVSDDEPLSNLRSRLRTKTKLPVKLEKETLKKLLKPKKIKEAKKLTKTQQFNTTEMNINDLLPRKVYRRLTESDEKKISELVIMKCDICEEKLQSFTDAQKHHGEVHNQKGYLMCCSRKFKQKSALVDHLEYHSNPSSFQCKICKKNYVSPSNLKLHLMVSHVKKNAYKCDKCGKFSNCKVRLLNHLMKHIEQEKPIPSLQCSVSGCDKSFRSRSGFKSHFNLCHNPNRETFFCEICGKELLSKNSLKEHIANTHAEPTKKIQCKICGHYIKNEYSMRKHLGRHKLAEGGVTCETCGRKCTTRAALRSHQRMKHLLLKNIPCRYCEKSFKQTIDLEEHEATHTGKILYSCLWCPATFKFGATFRAHRKKSHPEEYEKIKPGWLKPN